MNRAINSRERYLGVVKTTSNNNIMVGEPLSRGKTKYICIPQLVIETIVVVLEVDYVSKVVIFQSSLEIVQIEDLISGN